MTEQKNHNGRGIFYGVIGVATLVVAIIGATFAYFTATANSTNDITGDMASINFGVQVLKVTKADEERGGMIPMSNNMVEAALSGKSDSSATPGNYSKDNICTDDNGNAVCQVYKIVVTNNGSAEMFVDGYVALSGGSGDPADAGNAQTISHKTSMRWAQVFCTGTDNKLTSCTTAGSTTTGAETAATGGTAVAAFKVLDGTDGSGGAKDTTGFYPAAVKTGAAVVGTVTGDGYINGNQYPYINTNYIRISDHDSSSTDFTRTADATSALVINQRLAAKGATQLEFADANSSTNATSTDVKALYIVVWLSENGHNQTPGATPEGANTANPAAEDFFTGIVAFNSAQGSEVTATFNGYTAVRSDKAGATQQQQGSGTEPSNP